MENKNTTITGILAFLGLLSTQIAFGFDGDPETTINWGTIFAAFGVLAMGIFARDSSNKEKESE